MVDSLIISNDSIGHQRCSFIENYLIDKLNTHKHKLVPLDSAKEFEKALNVQWPPKRVVLLQWLKNKHIWNFSFPTNKCQVFTKMGWSFVSYQACHYSSWFGRQNCSSTVNLPNKWSIFTSFQSLYMLLLKTWTMFLCLKGGKYLYWIDFGNALAFVLITHSKYNFDTCVMINSKARHRPPSA